MLINERYEKEIINRFFLPDKKSRYQFALPRAKQRYAALTKLFANDEVDLRFAEEYGSIISFVSLSSIGKNTECYILSCNENIDGKVFPFEKAMAFSGDINLGILIYFPEQQTAYYKGEHGTEYILYNSP